jgi:hypothetical protein
MSRRQELESEIQLQYINSVIVKIQEPGPCPELEPEPCQELE